jgi:pyruvate formate lyase activating enzyme
MTHPLVVDIKRHSLEDGPGIRSVVFFKGCPLRCVFCQNPETQNPAPEIAFRQRVCIDCRLCTAACAQQALAQGPRAIDRKKCRTCGACTRVCPSGALALIGQPMTLDEMVEVLMRDQAYYRHSGGGVTLSGGECTVFPDFAGELLRRLRAAGIATAIETCGEFSSAAFAQWILPHVDLILFDLKLADSEAHQVVTGRGNERIWSNLKNLLAACPERVQVRIPLIPGITDDRKNLTALADRVAQLGGRHLTLLPYNPLGVLMAKSLGRTYPQNLPQSFQDAEQLRQTITWFTAEVARHFCATPTA